MSSVFISTNLKSELVDVSEFLFNSGSQFTQSNYTICSELIKNCADLSYFPNTRTFVITNDSFCNLVNQNEFFINNVSKSLNIDKNQAVNEISEFFRDKTLLVQQTGLQKSIYRVGTFVQTAGSASLTARTLVMAKPLG